MEKKILLVYKSVTGFTKKYAEMIAAETGCALTDLKSVNARTLSGYDTIIFGSRLFAGSIDGLKQARKLFRQSTAREFIIFATGATPNIAAEIIDEAWNKNLSAEELAAIPHFYMQSGLCYEKMPFAERMMMRMAGAMIRKKKNKTESEQGFEQAIAASFDQSSSEFIRPLVEYLQS